MATRELAARIMAVKSIVVSDDRQRELIEKTILASLNRAHETIERIKTAGVVRWRVRQAARARCQ
jgi:Na+-translocating ferredoxin:NAD+ oxidoreductase RnfC subunit